MGDNTHLRHHHDQRPAPPPAPPIRRTQLRGHRYMFAPMVEHAALVDPPREVQVKRGGRHEHTCEPVVDAPADLAAAEGARSHCYEFPRQAQSGRRAN
jgi:hypothetical protein